MQKWLRFDEDRETSDAGHQHSIDSNIVYVEQIVVRVRVERITEVSDAPLGTVPNNRTI